MRLARNLWVSRPALLIAATVVVLAAGQARADFVDPSFYGQANTTYQLWNGFSSAGGPNKPTVANNLNGTANAFDATVATDGAFLAGNHIYSFSGVLHPEIDLANFNLGSGYQTEVVLQVQVLGSPLDKTAFTLMTAANATAISPKTVSEVETGSSGSGFGGGTYFYTVDWLVSGNAANYRLNFTPNETSSSQVAYRVDTLASANAVPEPSSIASLSLGLFGFAGWWGVRWRRRTIPIPV